MTPKEEAKAKEQLSDYLDGWRHGAGFLTITGKTSKVFNRGWADGRKAKREAAEMEAAQLGIKIKYVELCKNFSLQ